MKKILLTSTQSPGNGGGATNIYKLNRFLLKHNIPVYCIFFLCNREDPTKTIIDPDNLGNVNYIQIFWKDGKILETDEYINKIKKKVYNHLNGEPDIIISKNFLAPLTSNILYPKTKLIYLVSGVYILTILNNESENQKSAQYFLKNFDNLKDKINKIKENINIVVEHKTMKLSDIVLTNSYLTRTIMNKLYPQYSKKIIEPLNTSIAIDFKRFNNKLINYNDRKYDIIYVCSNFERKIKNSFLINEIFLDKRLENYNKLVIGDNNIFSDKIKNLTVLNQQKNDIVLNYMNNSKLLLMTSLFDSSPNTLFEAIQCGCNVIISKNIGPYKYFNNKCVCEDIYDKEEWIVKILENIKSIITNSIDNTEIINQLLNICK
jgi:glycosyltransferase involved in cell wall biosynthesis